jgi:L-asparaginase II
MLRLMGNPVLIELTRGPRVESVHVGALAVAGADGAIVAAVGDITVPTFPRSAIKPLQALAFASSGAVEGFAFGARELAIACGSHSGTRRHVAVVAALLQRAGIPPGALGCGVHEPLDAEAARELVRSGAALSPLHHNCSGKHAGMLASAAHLGHGLATYWSADHPVQERIRQHLEELTRVELGAHVRGIDGCSVPNWAIPLADLAACYARFGSGEGLSSPARRQCRRVMEACWAEPELVAGSGRLDTRMLAAMPGEVVIKSGAEGVYCGALPKRGLGFAVKVDDGAKRAAEAVAAALVARLYPEAETLGPARRLVNWRGLEVGRLCAAPALVTGLAALR